MRIDGTQGIAPALGSSGAPDRAAFSEALPGSGLLAQLGGVRQVFVNPASAGRAELQNARINAQLAADVYNDVPSPPAGFRVANDRDLARLGLTRTNLEDPTSVFRARVYVAGEGDSTRYVIAFRGTAKQGDWVHNALQSQSLPSQHYSRAITIGRIIGNSGVQNIQLTGHSLGGGLASAAALSSGKPADTFNAAGLGLGSNLDGTYNRLTSGRWNAGRVDAYVVDGEALNTLQDATPLPDSFGTRRPLDAVIASPGAAQDPIARHGMDFVIRGIDRALVDAR